MSNLPNGAGPRIKPQKYAISGCTRQCSLNPANHRPGIGEMLHGWYEAGDNRPTIREKAAAIGVKLSEGAIGNHKAKHLVVVDERASRRTEGARPRERSTGKRLTDLEIIDSFIQRGAESIDMGSFVVSGEQLLKAIDLKQRLTQGSLFEKFYEAIGAVMDEVAEDEAATPEAPDAVKSEEEQGQVASED